MAKKKRKKRRRPIHPALLFLNARSYQCATVVLNAQDDKMFFLWPMMSCQAFSLELHLKCLHRLRRRTVGGHDVKTLFESLSKADRRRIREIFDVVIADHPCLEDAKARGAAIDVESILARASNMFEKGRYWHEGTMPAVDATGMFGNAGMDRLTDAVRDLILEIRPELVKQAKQVDFSSFVTGLIPPTSQPQ